MTNISLAGKMPALRKSIHRFSEVFVSFVIRFSILCKLMERAKHDSNQRIISSLFLEFSLTSVQMDK
ncbi:hypothetical protein C7B61_22200 [filamentous cyanobacterium CCP1]|nr:hypothetical protein C7B76_15350 [filamentous cyanobacterium CCP2]PSB54527.1 hypothetical protein C7B61_22200 [filamentous cyanobacterium CCP1]